MTGTQESEITLPAPASESVPQESLLSRFLGILCSVRLGVVLLILLGLACFVGMLIMQQNVDGFEGYYAQLTPSQRLVYGSLGLFDIYHAWYFNALLALVSMNIILASIDRFPKTWRIVSKPNLTVPMHWLLARKERSTLKVQGDQEAIVEAARSAFKKSGLRNIAVNEKNGRIFVFGESGAWNRLGAYAVHVGLLTIFSGGFLTAQFGHTGQMPLAPGQSSNSISEVAFELDQMNQVERNVPFEVFCTDIQQRLIREDGPITAGNTIDWLTSIRIKDETGTHEAVVHMNEPFDYRGYRFFQSSFVPVGRARTITLILTDVNGTTQNLKLSRDNSAKLADGTTIKFADFRGNFRIGQENPNEDTSAYPNPGAILEVVPPNGKRETAYAFYEKDVDIPIASKLVGGYNFSLDDFEKVSDQHILSVQRDPGADLVYLGFVALLAALGAVFFFSHKRIWIAIEDSNNDEFQLTVAGDTNRNAAALDDKVRSVSDELSRQFKEKI